MIVTQHADQDRGSLYSTMKARDCVLGSLSSNKVGSFQHTTFIPPKPTFYPRSNSGSHGIVKRNTGMWCGSGTWDASLVCSHHRVRVNVILVVILIHVLAAFTFVRLFATLRRSGCSLWLFSLCTMPERLKLRSCGARPPWQALIYLGQLELGVAPL
jgi:hypothetical protein